MYTLAVIDLPLSLIADTIVLPYTIFTGPQKVHHPQDSRDESKSPQQLEDGNTQEGALPGNMKRDRAEYGGEEEDSS